ncbi:MAG TPA: tRNA (adenosine(37)-N6)-threonylcarbamoyltransferase complex dimerization subunit type 1 TsaB [Burkholderiales bacterium]
MNVLALETSTDRLSVALSAGGELYASDSVAGQRHAELILQEVEALLKQADLTARDLDGIVYGEGPGSFTGLRIACGVTQGLALAVGARVLGVGTLAAIAEASGEDRVIACIDARMSEVYHAIYQRQQGKWTTVMAPGLYPPAGVPLPPGTDWIGCGNGFAAYAEALQQRHAGHLSRTKPEIFPTATAMISLALPRFAAGEGGDAATAAPFYLRDKVALKTSER